MADTSQVADLPPHSNGIDALDEDERNKMRPADIDADVREMERRKRVESIMNSRLFREELERIIETQLKEGVGTTNLMQQISDMMGVSKNAGGVFKNSSCVLPVNDIRGVEAMGYAKGEKILRCKLAAVFRLVDLYGWTQGVGSQITARLNQDEEHFLVNPYGMLFHEITASSLVKVDMQGSVVEQGTTNFGVNLAAFSLHAAIHAARPDIRCIVHVHTPSVVAVSTLKHGLLPLSQESAVIGEVSTHPYVGGVNDPEEKEKIARNLGPVNKVLLLTNQGAVCCGQTIEEAFFNVRNTVLACETQLKLISVGVDNLILLPDETRKRLYDSARKPPASTARADQPSILEEKVERKWRVGGAEFEALMRMLDNAGFRTGYIYRHPLVKGDLPRPKNDVELPPAVSSLGYLLEEEELYKQGIWRRLDGRKGHDRTRWLNSPNVYQKVEILETGTPDPKKITKWVAESSPTHSNSTPVRIDSALQFVPKNTNPKEFKQLQQQIKDYRRADKISAGPQSQILEGVTWEEAKKMQDAGVTQTGDHVVLMGAASKGIIQRGYQHNATVYKSPYAKNPFDSVTDEELDEYKKVIERKVRGEYDTDYSESEGLSSSIKANNVRSPTSETEEESKDEQLQVLRIETKNVPTRIHPEVVLSDGRSVIRVLSREQNNYCTHRDYRTYSHFGFPKGSYATPNPVHFHVVRYMEMPKLKRPVLVKLGSHPPTVSRKWGDIVTSPGENSTRMSISIGKLRNINVDITLQTLKEFIYPFASALNLVNLSGNLRDVSAQTSFVVKRDEMSSSSEDKNDSSESEFEKRIIQNLRDELIAEIPRVIADSDESTVLTGEGDFNKSCDSWAQVIFNGTFNANGGFRSLENAIYDKLLLLRELPYSRTSTPRLTEPTDDSDDVRNESMVSFDELQGLCESDIYLDASSSSHGVSLESLDVNSESLRHNFDKIVTSISKCVYEYLVEQCLTDPKNLVPDIPANKKVDRLLKHMRNIYVEHSAFKFLGETDKQEFKANINFLVVNLLETSVDISNNINKIDEFVSGLLDSFFDDVSTFGGCRGEISLNNSEEEFFEIEDDTTRNVKNSCQDLITAFKTKESKTSGSEKYWIAITKSPESLKISLSSRPAANRIINVDDIPLRPPSENYSCKLFEDSGSQSSESENTETTTRSNSVEFFRTPKATTSDGYVQRTSVSFSMSRDIATNESDRDSDEGDWMGYEGAKF